MRMSERRASKRESSRSDEGDLGRLGVTRKRKHNTQLSEGKPASSFFGEDVEVGVIAWGNKLFRSVD